MIRRQTLREAISDLPEISRNLGVVREPQSLLYLFSVGIPEINFLLVGEDIFARGGWGKGRDSAGLLGQPWTDSPQAAQDNAKKGDYPLDTDRVLCYDLAVGWRMP